MSAIFEWVNDSGTLGVPPMPPPAHPHPTSVASAEIATINQTYYELTVYLNDFISQSAKIYGVSKQQVFDVMKSRVKIGLPWCTHRTANPGDPATSCGLPPMASGAPPCCMMWWPDDCSFAGITELPYRPRPPCASTIIKWTDTYALDIGAYQTGMNSYANWKTDLLSKRDAIRAELKKLQPAPSPGGKPAPLPGEPDANVPPPGAPGGGGPPPAVSPEITSAIRDLMNAYRASGLDACAISRTLVRSAQRAVNVPVTGVYDAATSARVKSFNSFAPGPCQPSGEGDAPAGGVTETKKDNTALYVVGAVVGGTVLYFIFK